VKSSDGVVKVTVTRGGGSSGAATVSYVTANGSAVSGVDYTQKSGSLSWNDGETDAKSFSVPITGASSSSGATNKTFSVALSQVSGGTLGTPSAATVTIAPSSDASGSSLSVSVSGNHLVDGSGKTVQLRGVSVSALEFIPVQGWSAANPWGAQTGDATPNWNTIKTWKVNTVRIPLNEASWLGYQCSDASGAMRDPDPGHNYQATVKAAVSDATAAGLYVILDLHWTAPGTFCPLAQNPMADADNSIAFWTSLAGTFKSYPNVLFELFNEPFLFWMTSGADPWKVLRDGGTFTQYVTGSNSVYTASHTWQSAGMQQMLDAIRATGATNVVLVGAPTWSQDLSQWVTYKPTDALNQLAAVWHAYPDSGIVGAVAAALPKLGAVAFTWAGSVLSAGVPLVITETGDHNASGTAGAPFVSTLLPWADKAGASYLGWTWDVWGDNDNVLIKDKGGTPSDGFGVYFQQHLACLADGNTSCP
jgi:endoglucanase